MQPTVQARLRPPNASIHKEERKSLRMKGGAKNLLSGGGIQRPFDIGIKTCVYLLTKKATRPYNGEGLGGSIEGETRPQEI